MVQGVSSWLTPVKPRSLQLLEELIRSVIPTCSLPCGVVLHTFHFCPGQNEFAGPHFSNALALLWIHDLSILNGESALFLSCFGHCRTDFELG